MSVKIYSAADLTLLFDLSNHASLSVAGAVTEAAWSPDSSRLVTNSMEAKLWVWNISDSDYPTGSLIKIITEPSQLQSLVNVVEWSPDGQFLASTGFDYTHVWNPTNDEYDLLSKQGASRDFAWHPNSLQHLTTTDSSLRIENISNVGQFTGGFFVEGTTAADSVDWNSDGSQFAFTQYDTPNRIFIYNTETLQPARTLAVVAFPSEIFWSPDDSMIAAVINGEDVAVYNIATGQEIFSDDLPQTVGLFGIAWSSDSTKIAYGGEGDVPNIVTISDE